MESDITQRVANALNVLRSPDEKPEALWQFLIDHADETVTQLLSSPGSKWDIADSVLIGRIGSPQADRYAAQLVWLVADFHAPARQAATNALFLLSTEAILAGTREVAPHDPDSIDDVLREAKHRNHVAANELARLKG